MSELTLHCFFDDQEQIFHITENEVCLGRQGNEAIHQHLSQDKKISRVHARLYYDLSIWWVEDLGSTHGTFLDDTRLHNAVELSPGKVIRIGDTLLRVEFETPATATDPGTTDAFWAVDETQPPEAISEDQQLGILARVSETLAHSRRQETGLAGLLQAIVDIFPPTKQSAIRRSILLINDKELLPVAYWPPDRSYVSFTLARQAITAKQAFRWTRDTTNIAESLQNTNEALYAPMISRGESIGVIAVDTISTDFSFTEHELKTLGVIANIAGSALGTGEAEVMNRLPSVFISYSHRDRDFVNRLAADLRRRQIKVWFDERLKSGEEWRKQLDLAIQHTDALVLVMSPSSVASAEVRWEIDSARHRGKKLYPLLYQNCEIPDDILSIHYVVANAEYDSNIAQLVDDLNALKL